MRLGRRSFRLALLLAATAVVSGSLPALLLGSPPAAAQETPATPSTERPALTTYDSFRPGQPWLDTDGTPIQAHGGQVVVAEDSAGGKLYYWYVGGHREAPALFKSRGTYYLITSGATGWDPNPASYATATSILGEWTDHGNPAQGDGSDTTYRSQSTSVIPVDPGDGRFIYMGDRWTPSDLANSPYVWLPIRFGEGDSMRLPWQDEWTLADLTPQPRYTVQARMPSFVRPGESGALPRHVRVTRDGRTVSSAVTWDTANLSRPGMVPVTGTLTDAGGLTFTREVLVVPKHLQYVINAGGNPTTDWQRIAEIAREDGSLLNSVPEQPLGADPATGARWGFTSEGSKPRNVVDGDIYTTLRYAVSHHDLSYTMSGLDPRRRYTVYAGYYDPWPWANRAARVSINGTVVSDQQLFTAEPEAGTYADVAPTADGTITLTVSPTRAPDIQLSWVMVARQ